MNKIRQSVCIVNRTDDKTYKEKASVSREKGERKTKGDKWKEKAQSGRKVVEYRYLKSCGVFEKIGKWAEDHRKVKTTLYGGKS